MRTAEDLRKEMDLYRERIAKAVEDVNSRLGAYVPDWSKVIGIILGSGLGKFADLVKKVEELPYAQIYGFPKPTVEGHEGKMILGEHSGKKLLMFKGRFHYYEGYDMKDVTFPIRVLAKLGVKHLIVTNAAGGLNPEFQLADVMLIRDHISLFIPNPLIGPNLDEFGPRFVDMHEPYSKELASLAFEAARELGIELKEGVYTGVTGPTFETPAEIRLIKAIGGDAVGMSTVPEVIVAKHSGMKVLGFSVITDIVSEVVKEGVSHEEVLQVADRASKKLQRLVLRIIEKLQI